MENKIRPLSAAAPKNDRASDMERSAAFLDDRRHKGLLRSLSPAQSRGPGRIRIDGRDYADFSSNDYLGLSFHPRLIAAAQNALGALGAGTGASRLLSGDLELFHRLERSTADFKQKKSALLFNSGYQANLGILGALCGTGEAIFTDRLSHASLIDGARLSGARLFRFRHNDAGDLKRLLRKERAKFNHALIVTETVFSMDGDKCPLHELVRLKNEFDCLLMADEAHATGLFGSTGSGVAEELNASDGVDILMGTFGKALGSFGAYAACKPATRDHLINAARSFIYSTALPPSVAAANLESIEIVRSEPGRRKEVLENAAYLRGELTRRGFSVLGQTQIVPVLAGSGNLALRWAQKLRQCGHWVHAIRPPTVPEGSSRIRISITHGHSRELLSKLADDFSRLERV